MLQGLNPALGKPVSKLTAWGRKFPACPILSCFGLYLVPIPGKPFAPKELCPLHYLRTSICEDSCRLSPLICKGLEVHHELLRCIAFTQLQLRQQNMTCQHFNFIRLFPRPFTIIGPRKSMEMVVNGLFMASNLDSGTSPIFCWSNFPQLNLAPLTA